MARAIAAGSIAITTLTAGATHAITLPAEFATAGAPNSLEFRINGRSDATNADGRADLQFSLGLAKSATERGCYASHDDDAAANGQADEQVRDDCVIALLATGAGGGAVNGRVDIDSISTTQVVLINDQALPHAIVIEYLIQTVEDSHLAEVTEPAATGAFAITAPFTPDFGSVVWSGCTAKNTATAHRRFSHGVFNAGGQAVIASRSQDNAASSVAHRYAINSEVAALLATSGTGLDFRASHTGFSTNQADLNCIERSGSRIGFALLTKGAQTKVDGFSAPATDTTTVSRTGYGFQPRAISAMSVGNPGPQSADVAVVGNRLLYGVAIDSDGDGDADTQHGQAASNNNGTANMTCASAIRYDRCYINIGGSGSAGGEGSIQSFDAASGGGITWMQNVGGDSFIIVVAFLPPDLGAATTHQASVSFTGVAVTSLSAIALRAASASFVGAAAFSATPSLIMQASFAATGVGLFSAAGEIIGSGPQTHQAAVPFTGRATFAAAAAVLRAASVGYNASAVFNAQAGLVMPAAVTFTGQATFAADGEIFDPSTVRATLFRGMRSIRSGASAAAIRTTASIREIT